MTRAFRLMAVSVVVLLTLAAINTMAQERERTEEQIKAARDFEFEKLTFSTSLEGLLKLFPDSRVAPKKSYPEKPDNLGPMFVNTKDNLIAFVFFDKGYKNIKAFRIIYGDVPIKKMGGLDPVFKGFLKKFGGWDGKFEETKEADGLRVRCKWTYNPKVERRVTLDMKEFDDGKVNMTIIIENTSIK